MRKISPDLSEDLPISPQISPYLPISPQMRGLFRRRGTPSRSGRRTASQTQRGRWAGRPSSSRLWGRSAATSARSRGCVPASAGHYVVISSPLRVVGRSTVRGGWLVWSYREARLSLSLHSRCLWLFTIKHAARESERDTGCGGCELTRGCAPGPLLLPLLGSSE